jgi:AcrR family transcriptional regulator
LTVALTSVDRPNYESTALEQLGEARMARSMAAKVETSIVVLEAAKKVLRQNGYSKLSTRDVAAAAGVPLSQIHYHFGSKQGMVLALFDHLNSQLLDRQDAMFNDSTLTLSQQWDRACDYLDEDIASGYVRVLQELIAASWADSPVAKVIQAGLMGWFKLLAELARRAEREFGGLGPFKADEVAALVGAAFLGAESGYLLGLEKKGLPIRQSLRRFGDLIRIMEATHRK